MTDDVLHLQDVLRRARDKLDELQDDGPVNGGWKSNALVKLIGEVDALLLAAESPHAVPPAPERVMFAWYDVFNAEFTRNPLQAQRAIDGGNTVLPLWVDADRARALHAQTASPPPQPPAAHVMTDTEAGVAELHVALGAPDIAQGIRDGRFGVATIDNRENGPFNPPRPPGHRPYG